MNVRKISQMNIRKKLNKQLLAPQQWNILVESNVSSKKEIQLAQQTPSGVTAESNRTEVG